MHTPLRPLRPTLRSPAQARPVRPALLAWLTGLVLALTAHGGSAQDSPAPHAMPPGVLQEAGGPAENLFSGFETHVLENGLRVWYRHIPGAANTSVGVSIPYGADQDPRGKEEVAHYLEHMLFSDHRGVSEEDIKDQVESIGGRRNGFTSADQTFYYVTLPAEHGLFGIEWLSRIVEPHAMDPEVVERNRQPVALELRVQPRELFDHIQAALNPEWIRRPHFWEREFGIETRDGRVYDRYQSLHSITPDDLRDFYDRHYTPSAMILTVAGDLPRDTTLALIRRTFGSLEARPAPESYSPTVDPGRPFKQVTWAFRPDVQYRKLYRVYDLNRDSQVKLLFMGRYLSRRLSARLRFGEVKAVYGVSVTTLQRGPAIYFAVQAPVNEEHWDFARDVIDEELQALRDGSADPQTFAEDRQAVVERLVAESREAEDLVFWLYRALNFQGMYEDFPNLPQEFASLTQEDLAAFAAQQFTPEREIVYLDYPHPLTQGLLALLVVGLAIVVIRGTARYLVTPIDMTRIRYVARMRLSPPVLFVGGVLFLGGGIVAARLVGALVERGLVWWIWPVESYLVQSAVYVLLGGLSLVGAMIYASLPPRKLLVFPDHIRVKSKVYRSRVLPLTDVRTAGLLSLGDVRRQGRLFRTLPLALGLSEAAVYVEPTQGMGYLFRVRDPHQLLSVLKDVGVTVTGVDSGGVVHSEPAELPAEPDSDAVEE